MQNLYASRGYFEICAFEKDLAIFLKQNVKIKKTI